MDSKLKMIQRLVAKGVTSHGFPFNTVFISGLRDFSNAKRLEELQIVVVFHFIKHPATHYTALWRDQDALFANETVKRSIDY